MNRIRPHEIVHWHGDRAGLSDRGGANGKIGVGLADLQTAGVGYVGVPMTNTGWGKDGDQPQNYIHRLEEAGVSILRSVTQSWNPGLRHPDPSLGHILQNFTDLDHPGDFLERWLAAIESPCHGLAWNLELDIVTPEKYPVTPEDRVCYSVARGHPLQLERESEYISFRCWQFAALFRIMLALVRQRFGAECIGIPYSGYPGLKYRGLDPTAAYGCDWSMLAEEMRWQGIDLPPATYAACGGYVGTRLPPQAVPDDFHLDILHGIQMIGNPHTGSLRRWWWRLMYYRIARNRRYRSLRPGKRDGFMLVHAGDREAFWSQADKDLCWAVGRNRL